MSDDLKPNTSTEDTSIENQADAEVGVNSADKLKDQTTSASMESSAPSEAAVDADVAAPELANNATTDTAETADDSAEDDVDKTATATVAGIKSARAIPSITKTDTLVAAQPESADDDTKDRETSEIEAVVVSDEASEQSEDSAEKAAPFNPPPTQGKRFKEVRLDAIREKVLGTASVTGEEAEFAPDENSPEIGSAQLTSAPAEAQQQEFEEEKSTDGEPSASESDVAREGADRPDTNPMHPSTRQPRQPLSWQLQRNAEEKSKSDTDEEFPAVSIEIDTSSLNEDMVDSSVSGAKAMPSMSTPSVSQDKDIVDKTKPPSAIGDVEEGVRSSFTFKMTGEKLDRDTAVLSKENPAFQRALSKQEVADGTSTLGDKREVILVIRGMIERLVIAEKEPVKLGRFEPGRKQSNEIDLTPYGALDRGVSRVHAQLELMGNNLYVSDLGSTNGTYLAGARLEPNQPSLLHKGDDLLIGRLSVQVMFR